MKNKVHIDFETRSRIDIRKSGAGRYCTDPSTKILCVAWALNDGPVQSSWGGGSPMQLAQWADEGYTFVAHNAFFEYMIWKYVWKQEPPDFVCTAAKGCAHGLPWKLDKLAMALKLKEKKDPEGMQLIRLFSVLNKEGHFNDIRDFPEDFKKFVKYCEQDVIVEREIDNLLPDLTVKEQKIFQLTLDINERGLYIDDTLAQEATAIAQDLSVVCNKKVKRLTGGKIHSITQTVRLKNYLNETFDTYMNGVASDDVEEWLGKDIPEAMREILKLRLEFGRSSVAKFTRAIEAQCDDGRIRNHLVYHGASTGRWTSQMVQFQNLPRGGNIDQNVCIDIIKTGSAELFDMMYSNPMSALSTCIRGLVVAPEGKTLLVADYNAIEARVLMWIAGQKDAIQTFKEGRDIYVEMAQIIFNDSTLTKANKRARQLGKQTVLGCGYQMGPARFKVTCEGYGLKIGEELADHAVTTYRNTYRRVPSFWSDIERAAQYTVRHKKACRCGPVIFYIKGKFLYCQLPSGRSLAYYYPGIEEKETPWGQKKQSLRYFTMNSETKSFKKTFTYGGKLTENVVQAVARDIMAEAMLKLEEAGFPVILSVHDEIVCEVDSDDANDDLNIMVDIMCELPVWAKGCSITAEGWAGGRYRK